MRKYNNPRLLNTVVSGTGMLHPVKPHVIVSDTVTEFVKGDLMDANAISEFIDQKISSSDSGADESINQLSQSLTEETTARSAEDIRLDERITSVAASIPQAVADGIAEVVAGADADYDTLKEISDYIASDKVGAALINNAINSNATAIADEATRAANAESALSDRIDAIADDTTNASAISAEVTRATTKEAELESAIAEKANQSTTYTKDEVNALVNGVDVSSQLTDYALKSEVNTLDTKVDTLESTLEDRISDVEDNIPTRVSDLDNDANYISCTLTWEVGDYLYSDYTVSKRLNTSKTVIGICVAPASHFTDGKARFISLTEDTNVDISTLTGASEVINTITIVNADGTFNSYQTWSSDDVRANGGFGFDFQPQGMGASNAINGAYYVKALSPAKYTTVVPAPFNTDGSRNPLYFAGGENNLLSVVRESNNEWYYPTAGEMGYLIYSKDILDLKLEAVGGTTIGDTYRFYVTSSVVSSDTLFGVNVRNGLFGPITTNTYSGRKFIAIAQPSIVFKDNIGTVDIALTSDIPTKTSDLINDSGFLTQHQDLSAYATTLSVNQKIDDILGIDANGITTLASVLADEDTTTGILTEIANKANQSTTYTKTEVDTALNAKADSSSLAAVATSGSYEDLIDAPALPLVVNNNNHSYVDLGLPSGTLWATMNVGASSVTNSGLYFQWGDTQGYTADQVGSGDGQKHFDWSDYKYSNNGGSDASDMTKYNSTDGLTTLELSDDAVHTTWGGSWRMPTLTDFNELLNTSNCTFSWTTVDGVYGMLFTSKSNSNTLFFPCAGNCRNGSVVDTTVTCFYWSSSLGNANDINGSFLYLTSNGFNTYDGLRLSGFSIRGVLNVSNLSDSTFNLVAFTGDYNDLTNKPVIPTIPTKVSDLTNDVGQKLKVAEYTTIYDGNVTLTYNSPAYGSIDLVDLPIEGATYRVTIDDNDPVLCTAFDHNGLIWIAPDDDPITNRSWYFSGNGVLELRIYENSEENSFTHYIKLELYTPACTIDADYIPDVFVKTTDLATIATTGSYNDLTDKPTVAAQVQANWAESDTTSAAYIQNKPILPSIWSGTQAEYDAIVSPSADTIYFIKG